MCQGAHEYPLKESAHVRTRLPEAIYVDLVIAVYRVSNYVVGQELDLDTK